MNRLGLIALAAAAGIVVLYQISYPTYSCRYRMTVNVEVDGQMRSGSSVIEYSVTKQMQFLPTVNPTNSAVAGQAVFVDLGGQRSLIALLRSGDFAEDGRFPLRVVPAHFGLRNDHDLASMSSLRGKWELTDKELPTLVTLSDPNNFATLKVVRPEQFEQVFGHGVRWRSVVIEMTTDPVTRGLEARLPFLVSQKNTLKDPIGNASKFTPKYGFFIR
jgi:hypothetical protein